jgi:hypothetical protein
MKRKVVYGTGLVLLIGFISAGMLFSSFKVKTTSSESKPCKESMQDCCKKEKEPASSGGVDFENLSGKFFSSLSY